MARSANQHFAPRSAARAAIAHSVRTIRIPAERAAGGYPSGARPMLSRLGILLPLLLCPALLAQEAAGSGLGFLDAQSAISLHQGVAHDGLIGIAVDGAGHFWVSARRPTPSDPHRIFEVDRTGTVLASYDAPPETAGSAFGLRDGTYDAATNRLYWGIDPAGGPEFNVYAFDLGTRQFSPAHHIRANVITSTIRGLAFDGTNFWTANFNAPITAFDAAGNQVAVLQSPSDSVYGLAWHPQRQTLWLACQTGLGDASTQGGPRAPGVHLLEMDPSTGALTGNRFRADYLLPPGSNGVAGGAHIRPFNGGFVIDVLVQGNPHDGILELSVDSDVGIGCGGMHLGYTGGNAWAGNSNFRLVVTGVGATSACLVMIGFDTQTAVIPGFTACGVLTGFVGTWPTYTAGASRLMNVPIPSGVPPIGLSFQALEFTGVYPLDFTQVLWLSLVP